MKKYIYSLALAVATLGLASCSDSKQIEPTIQWYPIVTLEGEDTYNVSVGEAWTDPGFTAVNPITGDNATADVEVVIVDNISGEVVNAINFNEPGMYTIYYNSYGSIVDTNPTMSVTRSVYVYDPSVTASIAGTWVVNLDESYELYEGEEYYFVDDYEGITSTVTISQILPGFFSDGDLLGGIYSTLIGMDTRYASYLTTYGPNCFKLTGFLSMNASGEITLLSWERYSGFFDGFSMSDCVYDEETETISYYASLTWDPFGGEPEYFIVLEKYEE